MLTAKQPAGIASHSFSKNPHIPSFHIQGGERGDAEEVWARLAASQRPQDANIFKGEASRASRACQSEVALFRGSCQGSRGFKFTKLRRRRRKRQDTTATCQLTAIPWNWWIVHNVIKWQKIYFFINLDIYEVWMGKFLDILAAPLLHGMLNVWMRW